MNRVWVVVELNDHGDPIVAICATRAAADRWAALYATDPQYSACVQPEVREYRLDVAYESDRASS